MHESHETSMSIWGRLIAASFMESLTQLDEEEEEVNKSGVHDGSSCIYCVTNNSSYNPLPVLYTHSTTYSGLLFLLTCRYDNSC